MPRSEDSMSFIEICELGVLAAIGWVPALWIVTRLSLPLKLASIFLAVVLFWFTFGFGKTLFRAARRLAGGGGWFLLLTAGPLAGLNSLILWVVPTASRERLAIVLTVVAAIIAVVL